MTEGREFDGGLEEALRKNYTSGYSVDYSNFFLGMVMDDADDMRMGRLWVYIPGLSSRRHDAESGGKPTYGGTPPDRITGIRQKTLEWQQYRSGWIECYPLFPFFGSDDYRVKDGAKGRNALDGDVKSYGMSFQPRNGDMVGVMFAFGDASRAFWIGCMPKTVTNHMVPGVPGVAAPRIDDLAALELKEEIDEANARIPGLEKKHQRRRRDQEGTPTPKVPRYQEVWPADEFATNLLEAGLMCDLERGAGVSGIRRESPSYVIGFKSPGWTYDSEKKNINAATGKLFDGTEVGARQVGATAGAAPTRDYQTVETVGHQFVMDDHPEYQSIRMRTSAGSQILMNDSGNHGTTPYIFINTPKGQVWIELRDDGQINIYAGESVSIHAEKDLNIKTDGNLNLEVGGNMNVAVTGDMDWRVLGDAQMSYGTSDEGLVTTLMSGGSLDVQVSGIMALQAFGGVDITSGAYLRAGAATDFSISSLESIFLRADYDINMFALLSTKITAELSMDLLTDGIMKQKARGAFFIDGGRLLAADADILSLAGGGVAPARRAFPLAKDPLPAFDIDEITLNKVYPKPTVEQIYKCEPPTKELESILPRVPQHLPWPEVVSDSSGFSGWVEPERDETKNARIGATRASAFRPVTVRGMVGGVQGVWEGQPYRTQSPAEKPVYVKLRDFEPGELAKASAFQASDKIKTFIKEKEQLRIFSYRDAGKAWAIGYGHNIKIGDTINGVRIDKAALQELDRSEGKRLGGKPLIITEEEADRLFDADLQKFSESVRKNTTAEITQGQFDAMTSFAYNVGRSAFANSTMLRRLNEGKVDQVPHQWMRWINVSGVPNNGLRTRRDEELQNFFNA